MTAPTVIVNPRSANGVTRRRWPTLSRKLSDTLGPFETVFTDGPGSATVAAREALGRGSQLVVSVGGDGTHNEVANGFFEGARPLNPDASLGLIPTGTGGDLCRSLGLPADPLQAIAALGGPPRRVDVGSLRYQGPRGQSEWRCFLNVASCGVSGLVDRYANRSSKRLGGRVSFLWASVRALASYRDQLIQLTLDDGPRRALRITSLAVANGQYFGGGMRVAPQASFDDGYFDVTVWSGFGLGDFLLRSPKLYDGSHLDLPGAESFRAQRVTAESEESVLLDVDGEQPGQLPAVWEILPQALWVCGLPGMVLSSPDAMIPA